MPVLNQLYEQQREQIDLFVVVEGDAAAAERFEVEAHAVPPVLVDADKRAGELYQIPGVPFAVLIGPDGNVEGSIHLHSPEAVSSLAALTLSGATTVNTQGLSQIPLSPTQNTKEVMSRVLEADV